MVNSILTLIRRRWECILARFFSIRTTSSFVLFLRSAITNLLHIFCAIIYLLHIFSAIINLLHIFCAIIYLLHIFCAIIYVLHIFCAIIYYCCRIQKSPPIKRKLTLTRKKAKEVRMLVVHVV